MKSDTSTKVSEEWQRRYQELTPEERLRRGFDLSETARALAEIGFRRRYPQLSDKDFGKEFARWLYGESIATLFSETTGEKPLGFNLKCEGET